MNDAGRSGVIDEVASFSSCTRTELDLLSSIGKPLTVSEGTVVVTENALGRECFVITAGRAEVTRHGEFVGRLGAGEFFGEMSLLTGASYPATVTAATDLELMVFSPFEFDALLANAPSVVRKMLRMRRPAVA